MSRWDDAYLNSPEFLRELEWRAARYRELRMPRAAEDTEESIEVVRRRLQPQPDLLAVTNV